MERELYGEEFLDLVDGCSEYTATWEEKPGVSGVSTWGRYPLLSLRSWRQACSLEESLEVSLPGCRAGEGRAWRVEGRVVVQVESAQYIVFEEFLNIKL